MNGITVKHNGTNITGFVTSYERVHKICTGIGTLDIEIADTIGRTFIPWDEIDIWENGSFKVRYYVSSVEHAVSRSTIQLNCQDNSKRIVDYFIPDSYTVDYPSFNKYWIEKFLTEAGVDYEFTTSSPGTLLSNYTQLGLVTVYEQILTLLQMSGWYFYFDGNGKAIIGAMDVNFADGTASVGKTDILDILVTSNDKMLRNKALVFGAYDGYTGTNAKASVTVHTPWNYDHNDLRTVVISNSNIKDNGTAYLMANQIIKEFARITVEKHITLWGAREFNLGTALRVTSNVWKGRGLVTTFGVSMSSRGLVTNVVLDERCPRLFGFFDFGDYVYVGFYGDGVWRKHIKYDPTWYNFSTGLTDLNITDLYINEGVFGSVGASGGMFYAIDTMPWHNIPVSGFLSSTSNNVDTSLPDEIPMTAFSGLMARGVTIDKATYTVKYVVDNASGINMGDYFLDHGQTTTSGIVGVTASGTGSNFDGKRGWVVEYDVLAGDLVGTPYPISLSGCYAYTTLDIENDGKNDYVSVATSGSVAGATALGFNMGYHISAPTYKTYDSHSLVAYNLSDDFNESNQSKTGNMGTNTSAISVFNNESTGEKEVLWCQNASGTRTIKRVTITNSGGTLNTTTLTSPTISVLYNYITKVNSTTYNLYRTDMLTGASAGAGNIAKPICYAITWDTAANTITAESTIVSVAIPDDVTKSSTYDKILTASEMLVGTTIYRVTARIGQSNFGASRTNYLEFYMLSVDTVSGSGSGYLINKIDFQTGSFPGKDWQILWLDSDNNMPFGFQNGTYPSYALFIKEYWDSGGSGEQNNWLVYSRYGGTFQQVLIDGQSKPYPSNFPVSFGSSTGNAGGAQVTNTGFILYGRSTVNNACYIYNGDSVTITSASSIPFSWKDANIYPMFGAFSNKYIAYDGSTYYWCDANTFTATASISFPINYSPLKPFSTSHSSSELYYWCATNTDTSAQEILRYSSTGYYGTSIKPASLSFSAAKGFISGNFFIDYAGTAGKWLYIDNPNPDLTTVIYQILQRTEESNFKLIQQESYPIRLDISGNSPVVTVGSGESTFQSNYIYDNVLVTVQAAPSGVVVASGGNAVNDYRYTMIQPDLGTLSSGLGISNTILYAYGSGIFAADAMSFSGGFTEMFTIPSGEAKRIETSNYGYAGQYIFVSASGIFSSGLAQTFFQQDPATFTFVESSVNYPQSRATIIRLDDAV